LVSFSQDIENLFLKQTGVDSKLGLFEVKIRMQELQQFYAAL